MKELQNQIILQEKEVDLLEERVRSVGNNDISRNLANDQQIIAKLRDEKEEVRELITVANRHAV